MPSHFVRHMISTYSSESQRPEYAMAPNNCCLSCICTRARYGARVVAILDFLIGVIFMMKFLLFLLNTFSGSYDSFGEYPYVLMEQKKRKLYDLSMFSYLFLIFMVLYVNYNLRDSTYDRDISKIRQWLAINTILLLFFILAIFYIVTKYNYAELLFISAPLCIIHMCQMFVVRCFYNEVFSEGIDSNAVINQNASNGSATVMVPTAPNYSDYRIRDGDSFMPASNPHPRSEFVVFPMLNDSMTSQMGMNSTGMLDNL